MSTHDYSREVSEAPLFDQWRRVLPATGTYALVMAAVEATADLRTRPATRDSEGPPIKRRRRSAEAQETYEAMAHAVISALVVRELTLPCGWTRIPMGKQRAGRKGRRKATRYLSPALGRSLPGFVHFLADLGWLELRIGSFAGRERIPSLMRASPWLVKRIGELRCSLADLTRDPGEELIWLRAAKRPGRDERGRRFAAELLDYKETKTTRRWRAEIRELNSGLACAEIDYTLSGIGVDPRDRTMRRIFNGSWDEGGRLAGGFWAGMTMDASKAKPLRAHIRIEGAKIVSLDFSAMFMRLLYCEAGVQPPSGDLYSDIDGCGPEHRAGLKRLISALMFREGELTRCPRDCRPLLPDRPIRALVESIKRRHAPVAHLLETGVGMRLMRRESDILLAVLAACRDAGAVALPVHDAILVAENKAELARQVMLSAFHSVTGFHGEAGPAKRPEAEDLSSIASAGAAGSNLSDDDMMRELGLDDAACAEDAEADWF